jgi:hypothetical protein
MSDRRGVDRIGLGQLAGGAGEIADLARIDHRQRQAGRGHRAGHDRLVAAGGLHCDQLRRQGLHRSTSCARPSPSRATAKASPLGRRCTSSRSFATSIPTKCSMSRPCACGLALRPRRLFGLREAADGAPCSGTGSCTRGSGGLPSATAAPSLPRRRDEREIQGARAAGVSKSLPSRRRGTHGADPANHGFLAQSLRHIPLPDWNAPALLLSRAPPGQHPLEHAVSPDDAVE